MYKIGIDVGGTFIKAGIIEDKRNIIYKTKVPTPQNHSPEDTIKNIVSLITELKNSEYAKNKICGGIGIGTPSIIDSKNGRVLYANNFGWDSPVEMVDEIKKYHSEPVAITNDANAAALGEWVFNNQDNYKSSVLITIGTGIGIGIVLNGKLYEGEHAGAVEIGHMVIKSGGRKCTCGKRGCLETYVSTTGLIKTAMKKATNKNTMLRKMLKDNGELNGILITQAVREKDETALKLFDKYLWQLSEGLAVVVDLFRPDVIYIGGGICEAFDLMEEKLDEYVRENSFGHGIAYVPKIKKAMCGNDAGIIGAASLI